MIEKSCIQKYSEALMTIAKRNGEKVKIDNKTRTVTLADEGVEFSYWDDNGEQGLTEMYLRCGDKNNREEFLWLAWSTHKDENGNFVLEEGNCPVSSESPYHNHLGDNLSLNEILGEQVFDTLASDIESDISDISDLFDERKTHYMKTITPEVAKKLRQFIEKYPELDIVRNRTKEDISSELSEISRDGLTTKVQSDLIATMEEKETSKGLEQE